MASDNSLLIVSIVAVVVAAFALIFTVTNLSVLTNVLLAPSDTGDVSVEVASNAEIDFTTDTIDWGPGATSVGSDIEFLETNSTANPDVSEPNNFWDRANGDGGDGGFILENIGNTDVDLRITADSTAATFVTGGAGAITDPEFSFVITEPDGDSCTSETSGFGPGWTTFPTTLPQVAPIVCSNFNFEGTVEGASPVTDTLEIHVRIGVPEDADVGARTAQVTAFAAGV